MPYTRIFEYYYNLTTSFAPPPAGLCLKQTTVHYLHQHKHKPLRNAIPLGMLWQVWHWLEATLLAILLALHTIVRWPIIVGDSLWHPMDPH